MAGPNPGARRDNVDKGTPSFLGGTTFVFDDAHRSSTTTPHIGQKVLEFSDDCFSANFVVAVHPRNGAEKRYDFRDANKKTLYYQDHDGTWKASVPCTPEMTVLSWYGFDFQDKWTLDKGPATALNKWVFNKDAYTMRTPLPTNGVGSDSSTNTDGNQTFSSRR